MPLGTPSLSFGSKREREKKRFLGTPQTPAGGPLHPLGKGVALKLMPMGDSPRGVNLSGVPRGDAPWNPFSFLRLQARKRTKEVFGDTPNPGRGTPAPLGEGRCP